MKHFKIPSADFFYPQIFKKYRAKVMDMPEFVPVSEAPFSKRLVQICGNSNNEQQLRTALAMSCVTGKSFHMENLATGLHSKAMQNLVIAAGEISNAKIFGFQHDTTELRFHPERKLKEQTRTIKHVEVGPMQSVTHALHCLVPVLWHTPGANNSLFVVGGTNLLGEQCLDAYCESVLPLFNLRDFSIERDAPSPPVMGSFQIEIKDEWKRNRLHSKPVRVLNRGKLVRVDHAVAHGDREALASSLVQMLQQRHESSNVEQVRLVEVTEEFKAQASGPCIITRLEFEHYIQVFSRYYQPGETLEGFIQAVEEERNAYIKHNAPVQAEFAHLLLLPMVCSELGGEFRTDRITDAFAEECRILDLFLGKPCCETLKDEQDGTTVLVRVLPAKLK